MHPWFYDVNLFSFFQGVIVNCSLTIVSTFSNTLKLLSVHHPSDNQFSFQPTSPYVQLLPYQKIEVKMYCFLTYAGHKDSFSLLSMKINTNIFLVMMLNVIFPSCSFIFLLHYFVFKNRNDSYFHEKYMYWVKLFLTESA